jgi:hypothetical protein
MSVVSESERPGRYPRTMNGLVGAMAVLVVAVLGLVGFLSLFRDEPDIEPERVDYLEIVGLAQEAGLHPAYPAELPEGVTATRAEVTPDDRPDFDLTLLTDDDEFIGVVWTDEDLDDLLSERVDDEDVEEADPLSVSGSIAAEWAGYADPGGDLAYAAEVRNHTVLVYGSASEDDLAAIVSSLTFAPRPR